MGIFYKPLTPELRRKAIDSIESNIAELRTCEPNGLVNIQITAWQSAKMLISELPDGYPIPIREE